MQKLLIPGTATLLSSVQDKKTVTAGNISATNDGQTSYIRSNGVRFVSVDGVCTVKMKIKRIISSKLVIGRSQWPPPPRHELSSPARTLGSWVQIPLEAWMSVCVYSMFVLSCVQIAALRRADPPSKESDRLCKRSRN
jgi:hypothetical protein